MEQPQKKPLPIFPFVPNKVGPQIKQWIHELGDFRTQAEVEELIDALWKEPDSEFYYFYPLESPIDPALATAVNQGLIAFGEQERDFRKNQNRRRDYQKTQPVTRYAIPHPGNAQTPPDYWRAKLLLTTTAREHLDTKRKIEMEEAFRRERKEGKYRFDAFLSYASGNASEADIIHKKATQRGLRVFLAPKHLAAGDDFAEEIRASLVGSAELWVLVTPQSSKSEWVTTEWGAAWVLERRIVPILLRCEHSALPERLARLHHIDFHQIDEFLLQRDKAQQ